MASPFTNRGPRARRSEAWERAEEDDYEARKLVKMGGKRPRTSPLSPHPKAVAAELYKLTPKLMQAVHAIQRAEVMENFDCTDLDHQQEHFDAAWEAANLITELSKRFEELSTASLQYTEICAFVHEETEHGRQLMANNF